MNEIRDIQADQPLAQPISPVQSNISVMGDSGIDELVVARVVGLETDSEKAKYKDQLKTIVEWAKAEKYENPMQLGWIIKSLMAKLGSPQLGENWITRASRYAHLQMETRRLQQEQDSLIRG